MCCNFQKAAGGRVRPSFIFVIFAALRLRTDAAKRFQKIESATATIFKLLLVAEKHFRRLNAPALMREVHLGIRFEDGDRVTESSEVAA